MPVVQIAFPVNTPDTAGSRRISAFDVLRDNPDQPRWPN
jgi:hypothetical protein